MRRHSFPVTRRNKALQKRTVSEEKDNKLTGTSKTAIWIILLWSLRYESDEKALNLNGH